MDIETIDQLLASDFAHEREYLHLSPNENVLSRSAKKYLASDLSNRYLFSPAYKNEEFMLFGGFTALSKDGIQALLDKTEQLVTTMTGATNVLFAPLSGLHAMMMCVLTTSRVGDSVYCLDPKYGGHFATFDVIKSTGRVPKLIPFNKETLDIDYAALAALIADETTPYTIYIDASYSLIPFDVARIRKSIGSNMLIYDASHTIGLIMGGQFPNPLTAGADLVTANTHKTLPGAHKGMILFANKEVFQQVNGPAHAFYSSTHIDHTIALCITIAEMAVHGQAYAKAIIANVNSLGDFLTQKGLHCRRGDSERWTYTHQLHLLTSELGNTPSLARYFFRNNIAVGVDNMFEQGPFVRFGLQEITRRGAGKSEMRVLADIIYDALRGRDVKAQVRGLKAKLETVRYSFDTVTD